MRPLPTPASRGRRSPAALASRSFPPAEPRRRSLLVAVVRRRGRALALAATAATGHQIGEALVPPAIGLAVDHAVDGGPPASILLAVGGVLALFTLLATGGGTNFWQLTAATTREAHHLRVRTAARILADPSAGAGRRPGDLATVLVTDAKAAAEVLRAMVLLVSGGAGLLVTVAVLVRADPWLGLGITAGAPLLTLAVHRIGPWLEHRIAAGRRSAGLAAALAAELVHAIRPLRGFGGVPEAVRRYRHASRTSLEAALRGATASAAAEAAGALATGLVLTATAAAAAALTVTGRISAGDLVTVVAMASFAGEPVDRLAAGIKTLAVARAGAARIATLLDQSPPAPSAPSAAVAVRPGEMLGVVANDPAVAGAITVSGAVLVEPHAVHLLGRTLEEVLDTGRAIDPEVTARAVAAAQAGDVTRAIADGGANLSGGQRQRLALAARPAVLVLRDPLTAVDAVTEDAAAAGLAALRRADGGATVVITTSPALLARCDRVTYLDGSRPPVDGIHDDLSRDPGYAAAVLR
ncbi:ABC transporter transmembrane domain-containing protein [Symbioplanes lichenis]|uniref:ABC transporter transmembrane domain-containing protein n=1 Tax=Symbioplanes lichenis TaxID=1629072 RepID=UPI002738234D|nr:ABC transporter ATP-binding protein [Actinoplanes lichenis]